MPPTQAEGELREGPPPHEPHPGRRLRLLDLAALVVAYGLAALLIRALWPHEGMPSPMAGAFVVLAYAWLGLAMGGPLVLLIDRRTPLADENVSAPSRYTWAETAWLLIGGYWLGLAMFVVPTQLPVNPLLGVFPVVAALTLRAFGPSPPEPSARKVAAGWTHAAAIVVLWTWPFAWAAMIVLGKTLS